MAISTHFRFKIVREVAGGKDVKEVVEKYSQIGLTSTILNTIINKSTKCRVIEKKGKLYRKCIYCIDFKEINEKNFRRDASKKSGFAGVCKYHAQIKQKNYRKLNREKYLKQHNEEQKRYYQNHKEEMRDYSSQYYRKNKKELNRKSTIAKKGYRQKALESKITAARNNIF